MFGSSINCLFFLLIVLACTPTNVFSDCDSGQSCSGYLYTWCCRFDQTCGTNMGDCVDESDVSPVVIAIIVVFSIFFFVMCLTCCIHSQQRQQRLRIAYANSNTRVVTNPYQQSGLRGPVRVVRVRPIYNIGAAPPSRSYPSIYEAPPPSYEAAMASRPSVHQSSPSPPVTTNVQ